MDAKAIRVTFLAATLGLFCAVCPGRQTASSRALTGDDERMDVNIHDSPLAEETPADPNLAHHPSPPDRTVHESTWANLEWSPGRHAASHDVYFSDNLDDVNNGVDEAFLGNQTETFRPVGYPDFPSVEGLIPGTTYYWRIDEVNDLHPDSPWKGDVWSFTIMPTTAYDPVPGDGAESVDPNVTVGWKPGFGARLHTVYFGDTFNDVDAAEGGIPQESTTYTPGPLELGKTYYWRVDEFDLLTTHRGDIWSFTTGPLTAYNPDPPDGAMHEELWGVLSWSPGRYAASHDVYFGDSFHDVNAGLLDAFHGNQLDTFFLVGFPPCFSQPRDLYPDQTFYWRVDEVNDLNPDSPWRGEVWSFTVAPKTAYHPSPPDGNDLVDPNVTLEWKAGLSADLHIIYFGDNLEDVNSGTAGGLPLESASYNPGPLELGKTYYWRVDEFDGWFTHRGDVWSFTTVPLKASNPYPPDGSIREVTWAVLQWSPGYYADSHDVYISRDFDEVNEGADNAFWGNTAFTMLVIGFPDFTGFSAALGMEPGATIYWRVDEVNDLHPDSPWRGDIWSFWIPPRTAYDPVPADGADSVNADVVLSWKTVSFADIHTVYFGDSYADVEAGTGGALRTSTSERSYVPAPLEPGKTYYWRVDTLYDWGELLAGDVWSFTTALLTASNPDPPDGAIHDLLWAVLSWSPGYYADSHDIYISRSGEDVAGGSYDAFAGNHSDAFTIIGLCDYTGWSSGIMQPGATVYWRVDEVKDLHPDSPWEGDVWSFTIQQMP